MTSRTMEGKEDFLGEIFMAEDRIHKEGYTEGYGVGSKTGFTEGQVTGLQKGTQTGHEIGFYKGCVAAWKVVMEKENITGKEKKLKALSSLDTLLTEFNVCDISSEEYWEQITKIRAKFKQVKYLELGVKYSDGCTLHGEIVSHFHLEAS
ncbi:Oral cancer-overexpressed protein 1 [Holothuria leucospilota]|uniref:Oral cancer-overexpressed protein 1 n=1 Tax=Holothuria leucospilota TaxID=206669 RepID=A0A9Q1BTA0_HOLLE|nr:Oral cancer-overexpressed protein 1 [Holothuria leucospilota]